MVSSFAQEWEVITGAVLIDKISCEFPHPILL